MKNISFKKFYLRIFLILEILVCMIFYVVSSKGYTAIKRLRHEGVSLCGQITTLKHDIQELEHQAHQFKTTPYLMEKIAREQLQYAFEGEEIFIVKGY